jgi:hypothetical protein
VVEKREKEGERIQYIKRIIIIITDYSIIIFLLSYIYSNIYSIFTVIYV